MTNTATETMPLCPADVFMHMIVAFLTPMFLVSAGGDAAVARAAAAQTVESYTARNPLHLLAIAQMIALGFGVLSSISLSMADSLSIPTILRLRGNAASLNRAAEQCRRALAGNATQDHPACEFDPQTEQLHEEATIARLARAEQRLAEMQPRTQVPSEPAAPVVAAATPQPADLPQVATTSPPAAPPRTAPAPVVAKQIAMAPLPSAAGPALETPTPAGSMSGAVLVAGGQPPAQPPTPLTARPDSTAQDAHRRNAWAAGMTRIARELTSDLTSLPPAERRAAGIRASALSTVAQELLSNDPMPPSLFKLPRR